MFSIELSKRVTRLDPARPTTGWSLSESTQPGSFISEPEKLEPGPTHHGLVGKRVGSLTHLITFFLNKKKIQTFSNLNLNKFHSQKIMLKTLVLVVSKFTNKDFPNIRTIPTINKKY